MVKRRGVSEVTGSVIMLGVVGTIGALILTLGLSSILNFQTFLIDVDVSEQALKESLVVEHVHFNKVGNANEGEVNLYVRNVGLNDLTIESIIITNSESQALLIIENTNTYLIQPKTLSQIDLSVIPGNPCANNFNNASCLVNFEINLVTVRGNIFETEATPYDT